jgi:hypothetical protein
MGIRLKMKNQKEIKKMLQEQEKACNLSNHDLNIMWIKGFMRALIWVLEGE